MTLIPPGHPSLWGINEIIHHKKEDRGEKKKNEDIHFFFPLWWANFVPTLKNSTFSHFGKKRKTPVYVFFLKTLVFVFFLSYIVNLFCFEVVKSLTVKMVANNGMNNESCCYY